jgi:putative acetyltransferase
MPFSNAQHQIEPATPRDFPEIAEVWEASVRDTHHFLTEEDICSLSH